MRTLALALFGSAAALTSAGVSTFACVAPERDEDARAGAAQVTDGAAEGANLRDPAGADGRRAEGAPAGGAAGERTWNDAIGLGPGGAGGQFGSRSSAGSGEPEPRGLERLAATQAEDGGWRADSPRAWRVHDAGCPCADPARALDDSGMTALALLAFAEGGQTARIGPQRDSVARGLARLGARQDRDSGRIGAAASIGRLYDHALATAALGEAFYFSRDPALESTFVNGLRALEAARIPGSVWSAATDGRGSPDVYVSAWAVAAFAVARECELDIDPRVLPEAERWLTRELDTTTALVAAPNARAATAAVLFARVRLLSSDTDAGELVPALTALVELQAARERPAFECELDGTLFGSFAVFGAGHGPSWKRWSRSLADAVHDDERIPASTLRGDVSAMLSLSVYFRYARVLVR